MVTPQIVEIPDGLTFRMYISSGRGTYRGSPVEQTYKEIADVSGSPFISRVMEVIASSDKPLGIGVPTDDVGLVAIIATHSKSVAPVLFIDLEIHQLRESLLDRSVLYMGSNNSKLPYLCDLGYDGSENFIDPSEVENKPETIGKLLAEAFEMQRLLQRVPSQN